MRKFLFLLLPVMVAFSSCDDYGKKVAVGESEVFYKGEGVTQKDAEKVGDFLLENKLFDKKQKSSAQVTKDGDTYVVHLVMDAKKMDPGLKLNMWKLQANLSNEVFGGADARFAFTDERLKDQETLGPVAVAKVGNTSVTYDSGDFTKKPMQNLATFLQEKGLLTADKEADILVRKEEGQPMVRIIVNKDYIKENEETVLPVFGYWQYLIQNNLPAFKKATFWLTTTEYADYKKVPGLSDEEVAKFESSQAETAATPTETTTETAATDAGTVPAPQDQ
jgi:hypothetical protein